MSLIYCYFFNFYPEIFLSTPFNCRDHIKYVKRPQKFKFSHPSILKKYFNQTSMDIFQLIGDMLHLLALVMLLLKILANRNVVGSNDHQT